MTRSAAILLALLFGGVPGDGEGVPVQQPAPETIEELDELVERAELIVVGRLERVELLWRAPVRPPFRIQPYEELSAARLVIERPLMGREGTQWIPLLLDGRSFPASLIDGGRGLFFVHEDRNPERSHRMDEAILARLTAVAEGRALHALVRGSAARAVDGDQELPRVVEERVAALTPKLTAVAVSHAFGAKRLHLEVSADGSVLWNDASHALSPERRAELRDTMRRIVEASRGEADVDVRHFHGEAWIFTLRTRDGVRRFYLGLPDGREDEQTRALRTALVDLLGLLPGPSPHENERLRSR